MDEGQARNPNTTYNGYKMELAHMPSATQNNSKRTKQKQPRKEEYPEPYWAKGKPTTQYINPSGH